jgi:hypothetical protein
MRRYAFFAVLGLALLTSSVSLAEPPPSNGYIGVFGDAAGTQCCFQLPAVQNGNQKIYVFYVTGGAAAAGISGAEFKVSFEPPATNVTFLNWANGQGLHVVNGNPIDNGSGGGATMSTNNQNQCLTQNGIAGDMIPLGEIHVKDLYDAHQLVVGASDTPANPNFACPAVFLCDGPAYTEVALTLKKGDSALGGQDPVGFITSVNGSSCSGSSCGFVATEPTTWSTVKGLFR